MSRDDFIAAYPHFQNPYGEPCAISDVVGALCIKRHERLPFEPIGTGFLIAGCGLFVTATHVVEELSDRASRYPDAKVAFYHTMPDNSGGFRPIAATYFLKNSDVAVGLCAPIIDPASKKLRRNNQLILSSDIPLVGEPSKTISFPHGMATAGRDGGTTVLIPDVLDGKIIQTFPKGRGATFPTPCLVIEGTLQGGSSGGPVLDQHGRVIGVNSMGGDHLDYWYAGFISDIVNLRIIGLGLPLPDQKVRLHPSIKSLCGDEITFWPPLTGGPGPELQQAFTAIKKGSAPIPLNLDERIEQITMTFSARMSEVLEDFERSFC
jgi:hypothetical protein